MRCACGNRNTHRAAPRRVRRLRRGRTSRDHHTCRHVAITRVGCCAVRDHDDDASRGGYYMYATGTSSRRTGRRPPSLGRASCARSRARPRGRARGGSSWRTSSPRSSSGRRHLSSPVVNRDGGSSWRTPPLHQGHHPSSSPIVIRDGVSLLWTRTVLFIFRAQRVLCFFLSSHDDVM